MHPDSNENKEPEKLQAEESIISLRGMYEHYFLDYASYVILERAVPTIEDGLKPVQRRILHSLKELDDGRYNKVANIVGNTMKYHPHGDASIGDAMVQLGQRELLIDTQGNWGNILTGDNAAASRYIEARLTPFAKTVVFNPKTTNWQLSYDGRNKEPITLPVKFPLLLAHGAEGIAVGLACKILPHNFNELIDASIKILREKPFQILPDFSTGGVADFSKYNDGLRGGKIRVRSKMQIIDNKTIAITEIPFGTTTTSLIDSIIAANDKSKIKIKRVTDNTADSVEILIHLNAGTLPDKVMDALYAFTNCEMSISPNACVIHKRKPVFIGVSEILKINTQNTRNLLKKELEIEQKELLEKLLYTSLEKIFIENRIYRNIEECETWNAIINTIDNGITPFKKQFYRTITTEDIAKLTEIKIKRISKYDGFKADEQIKTLNELLKNTQYHLAHLTDYAIDYFKTLKKQYGKDKKRRTQIQSFENIEATKVVARNFKLYVDYENGFIGYGLKGEEAIAHCSEIDDIIVFLTDGTMQVVKIDEKVFVGKNIIHAAVWDKDGERTIYHVVYRDGARGYAYIKRFSVTSVIRNKVYNLTKGNANSQVLYFSSNPNGESELLSVHFKPKQNLRKQSFEFNLASLAIKGRNAQGNILTKHAVRKIVRKEKGDSTLEALQYWFDEKTNRINTEENGKHLGSFEGTDRLLIVNQAGYFRIVKPDTSIHIEENTVLIEKYEPDDIFSVIYFDGDKKSHYCKRFQPKTLNKNMLFIGDNPNSKLVKFSFDANPVLEINYLQGKSKTSKQQKISIVEFIHVKSEQAKGKMLPNKNITALNWQEDMSRPIQAEDKIKNSKEPASKQLEYTQSSLF